MIAGKSKTNTFKGMREKITKKVTGGKRNLSHRQGGKSHKNHCPSGTNVYNEHFQNTEANM